MSCHRAAASAALLLLLVRPSVAAGDESLDLTLADALRLARQNAPDAAAQRGDLAVAEGHLRDLSIDWPADPLLDGSIGRRDRESGGETTDWDIGLTQPLDLFGVRAAERRAAQSDVEAAGALVLSSELEAAGQAGRAFLAARESTLRRELLAAHAEQAEAVAEAARQRAAAGDLGSVQAGLARAAAGAARVELLDADADAAGESARLAALVGAPTGSEVQTVGELQIDAAALDDLLAALDRRSDLVALQQEAVAADAEGEAARARRHPPSAVRLGYAHDDGDEILSLGFEMGLSLTGRGQGAVYAAEGRAGALRAGLALRREAAETTLRGAWEQARRLDEAARLASRNLAELQGIETDALAAFEAHEIDLTDLLAARREIVAQRLGELQARLRAATAWLEVRLLAGELP